MFDNLIQFGQRALQKGQFRGGPIFFHIGCLNEFCRLDEKPVCLRRVVGEGGYH